MSIDSPIIVSTEPLRLLPRITTAGENLVDFKNTVAPTIDRDEGRVPRDNFTGRQHSRSIEKENCATNSGEGFHN